MTSNDQVMFKDLDRAERSNIPVNLIYPPNYPESPAILLEEVFGPGEALDALKLVAKRTKASSVAAKKNSSSSEIAAK